MQYPLKTHREAELFAESIAEGHAYADHVNPARKNGGINEFAHLVR
jgi:hypothetical protein